jgi:hypothetical protein
MNLKFITRNGWNNLKKHLKTESSRWAISIQQTVKERRADTQEDTEVQSLLLGQAERLKHDADYTIAKIRI